MKIVPSSPPIYRYYYSMQRCTKITIAKRYCISKITSYNPFTIWLLSSDFCFYSLFNICVAFT